MQNQSRKLNVKYFLLEISMICIILGYLSKTKNLAKTVFPNDVERTVLNVNLNRVRV